MTGCHVFIQGMNIANTLALKAEQLSGWKLQANMNSKSLRKILFH